MSLRLQSRFLAAEELLLSAFSAGPQALNGFKEDWETLARDYTTVLNFGEVDEQVDSCIHATASRVAVLAGTLLSLEVEVSKVCSSWNAFVGDLFSQTSQNPTHSESPSSPRIVPDHLPIRTPQLLSSVACAWISQNIHDPYPPSAVKASIAESARCSVKDVQEWFAEARRWIGWTALCQEKFGGSRRLATEAAVCAYSEGNMGGELSLEIERAFNAIKDHVRDLHPHPQSPAFVEDASLNHLDPNSQQGFAGNASQQDSQREASHPPEIPPRGSPVWSLAMQDSDHPFDEEENMTPPPRIAGCKRRFDASMEIMDEGLGCTILSGIQPCKRLRRKTSLSSSSQDLSTGLVHRPGNSNVAVDPSQAGGPGLSSEKATQPTIHSYPFTSVDMPSTIPISGTREAFRPTVPTNRSAWKRRLSDAAFPDLPKRRRGLPFRKQIVSDPSLPSFSSNEAETCAVEDWLRTAFSTPQISELECEDHSSCYDVESVEAIAVSPLSQGSFFPVSQLDVSEIDLLSATIEGFDFSGGCAPEGVEVPYHLPADDTFTSSSPPPIPLGDWPNLDLSQYSDADWSQFIDILTSSNSSPTSSQSSLWEQTTSAVDASDVASSSLDDISHTMFGVDPSFTSSDLLSEIGGFSSLHMPLEATF